MKQPWDDEKKDDDTKRYIPHHGMKIIDPEPIKNKIDQDITISMVIMIIAIIIYMLAGFVHELKLKELRNFDKCFNAGFYDG